MILDEIERCALEMGAFKVGFSNLGSILPERLQKFPYGISIAVPLSKGIFSNVVDRPTHEYFHHYRTINRLIDDITLKITLLIEKNGSKAYPIAASQSVEGDYKGVFPHKSAAHLSGIGWIGKSALLVTKEHGPRVRFGTILTDMDLGIKENKFVENLCGNCKICTTNCPASAIYGKNYEEGMERSEFFDAKACSDHMKNKYKDIGRGAVCGICIASCPYSK